MKRRELMQAGTLVLLLGITVVILVEAWDRFRTQAPVHLGPTLKLVYLLPVIQGDGADQVVGGVQRKSILE